MVIDAHQHFWHYDKSLCSWITPDMEELRRDFLPEHLDPILRDNKIDGCIAVQASQSENETLFLLELADKYFFIKGVIGWIDLQSEDIDSRLSYFSKFKKLKGFRHVLQSELNRSLMLTPAFQRGISYLEKFGFSYELLILPDQLRFAYELAKAFPTQKFVLNHLAKPPINEGKIADWSIGIRRLALQPNVWCKISGLVTEAARGSWHSNSFMRYLDVVWSSFGPDRIMFGSDWPVCLTAADYCEVKEIITEHLSARSNGEKEKIWGGNAIRFYQL